MIRVLSVENMRMSDKRTTETKTSGAELMMRAAQGIAEVIEKYYENISDESETPQRSDDGKCLIVCGSGNNAGDGFAVALILEDKGISCDILLLADSFSNDGKYYYDKCMELGLVFMTECDCYKSYGVILDCIFGTGFHGPVRGKYKDVIEKINDSGAWVVSADINSGLNGDSGRVEADSVCVRSDVTVSIGDYKPGHFLADAQDLITEKVNVDIGIEPVQRPFLLLEEKDIAEIFGTRKHNSHKGSYGYMALIGGSLKYSGAIRLADMAQSSMRCGAGVVKLAVPGCICNAILPGILESTLFPLSDKDGQVMFVREEMEELLSGVSTVAVGMGIGNSNETEKILDYLLKSFRGKLIIDADGLNALARNLDMLKTCVCEKIILTPHPKEFSRLTGLAIKTILGDPCRYAWEFAGEHNVTVLLKGNTTVVSDGEAVYLSDRGCPGMATAGSGDVLSGVVAAMVSQTEDSALAAAGAAFLTGMAGELAQDEESAVSMLAGDTANHIRCAVRKIMGD